MSIGNNTENNILGAYFRAVAITGILINHTSSPITAVEWALHTADPGDAGSGSTSEAAYTSYVRKSINRDTTDFAAPSGGSISPAADVTFAAGTGGSGTGTYFSTVKPGGGAADIFWSGAVSPTMPFGNGLQPILASTTAMTLD